MSSLLYLNALHISHNLEVFKVKINEMVNQNFAGYPC